MTTYILVGEIRHPGRIEVEADTLDQALEKADNGEFVIYDEQNNCLAFDWNTDVESVEEGQ